MSVGLRRIEVSRNGAFVAVMAGAGISVFDSNNLEKVGEHVIPSSQNLGLAAVTDQGVVMVMDANDDIRTVDGQSMATVGLSSVCWPAVASRQDAIIGWHAQGNFGLGDGCTLIEGSWRADLSWLRDLVTTALSSLDP